jgi:nitroreductase
VSDERTAERGRYAALLAEIRGRRSVRRFVAAPVPDEDVQRLLEAARWAPSPTNRQPWRFCVVRDAGTRERMRAAVESACRAAAAAAGGELRDVLGPYADWFTTFADAPVVIAVLARRPSTVAARLGAGLTDNERAAFAGDLPAVGAAVQNLLLAAHALGYGACWMAGPVLAARELCEVLGAPSTLDLLALIPVGRPAERPEAPPRRELARLLVGTKEPARE